MSQVVPRGIGEETTESLGGFSKMIQQTLATSIPLLDHPDDYLSRRLKISQLLSLLITISCQLPDLLHITDHLFVSVSFDLGQLLHSICMMIHNIGQISYLIILLQQQAFKLCQTKENMSTEGNYSKDNHQRRKRIPFFSLAADLAFSCSLEALSFRAELSCSKDSTRASNNLTFSDCSRETSQEQPSSQAAALGPPSTGDPLQSIEGTQPALRLA